MDGGFTGMNDMARFYRMLAQRQYRNFNESHYDRLINITSAAANFGLSKVILSKEDISDKEIEYLRDDGFIVEEEWGDCIIQWGEPD